LHVKKELDPFTGLRKMAYLTLLLALAVFTLLDALNTIVGLRVGLIELNPVVTILGLQFWVPFRMLLLGCMETVFFSGYRFFQKHFPRGLWILTTTVFMLDIYIGAVVVSGFLAICLKLLF